MLILTRAPSEVIRIGHDISVVVVDIHGQRVRLGIVAPSDVEVHRQEVYEKEHGGSVPEGVYRMCSVDHCKQPAYRYGDGFCREHWELSQ